MRRLVLATLLTLSVGACHRAGQPPAEAPAPAPSVAPRSARPSGAAPPAAEIPPSAREGPAPLPPPAEPLEGFGAGTAGGAGGRTFHVREASEKAVRDAFLRAVRAGGHAVIRFEVTGPIALTRPLPLLTAPYLTIEGRGATLDGGELRAEVALVDVRSHDVIVRDLRLRNGYDNLRIQGAEAYNVVASHVSSTGARDDGVSIGYGAHDVTVQWAFLAGNTRSVFCRYEGTNDISLHHVWIQKGFIRSPLFSGSIRADVRNVIVEDWGEWGARFEDGAYGNVIGSLFILSPYGRRAGGKTDSALRFKDAGPVFLHDNTVLGADEPSPTAAAAAPAPAPPVRTLPADAMSGLVRARAGCLPRDRVDLAYILRRDGWRVTGTEPLRLTGQ